MKKKFLIFLLFFNHCTVKATLAQTIKNRWQAVASKSIVAFGTHTAINIMHELGHFVVVKTLLATNQKIIEGDSKKLQVNCHILAPFLLSYPQFQNRFYNILINLAGPAGGLLGTYLVLKGENIYAELSKGKNIKEAIKDGIKKKCINNEQPLSLRIPALMHIAKDSCLGFIPLKQLCGCESHGDHLIQDIFGIKK